MPNHVNESESDRANVTVTAICIVVLLTLLLIAGHVLGDGTTVIDGIGA